MSKRVKTTTTSVVNITKKNQIEHDVKKKINNNTKHSKEDRDTTIPKDVLENKATEVGPFWSVDKPIEPSSLHILTELVQYYTHEKLEKLIVPRSIKKLGVSKNYILTDVIKKELSGISLRAIEHLVTNYSKGIKIVIYDEKQKKHIDIHGNYETESGHYKRGLFDPFCRHERLYFLWKLESIKSGEMEDVVLLTTVGQLNFMKWAENAKVLTYAQTHKNEIQKAMEEVLSKVNNEKKHFKKLGQKRKRKELTKAPEMYCAVYSIDTTLYFDHLESDED
jgi:hypothetical protein